MNDFQRLGRIVAHAVIPKLRPVPDTVSIIVCIGPDAIYHRINADLECEARDSRHVVAIRSDADARNLPLLRGQIAYLRMGALSPCMGANLQVIEAPEVNVVEARAMLRRIMEADNG